MSWGTYYKHEGYLSRIGKNELYRKQEELNDINDDIWREILAYMAMTPPVNAKDCEGEEYPWAEFISSKISEYRQEIEENLSTLTRIGECLEVLDEHPEDVKEG